MAEQLDQDTNAKVNRLLIKWNALNVQFQEVQEALQTTLQALVAEAAKAKESAKPKKEATKA